MTRTTAGTKAVYRRCSNDPATSTSHDLLGTGVFCHKTWSPGQLGSASLLVFKPLGTHQMPTWETQPTVLNLWTTSTRLDSSLTHFFAEISPVWAKCKASADLSWCCQALESTISYWASYSFRRALGGNECWGQSRVSQGDAMCWRAKPLDAASSPVGCS